LVELLQTIEDATRIVQKFLLGRGAFNDMSAINSSFSVWAAIKSRLHIEKVMEVKEKGRASPDEWASVDALMSRMDDMEALSHRISLALKGARTDADVEKELDLNESSSVEMLEQAATASWMKQLADIGLIVGSIMGAVFFTLLLLAGNTMMQAVRERTSELAVMKTIGFSSGSLLTMVLAESVLLLVLGGMIGLALAAAVIPAVTLGSGGLLNLPSVGRSSWVLGGVLMVLIGVLVGALPASKVMRLKIVDALAGR